MAAADRQVRRSADRSATVLDWVDSRHCFSFGPHYDPQNLRHGPLLVLNEDVVAPGAGYADHVHREVEIVTWMLSGALAHQDACGNRALVHVGHVAVLSAGVGLNHSEQNPSACEPAHFVQMWIEPDQRGGEPTYAHRAAGDRDLGGGLTPLASGSAQLVGQGALPLRNRGATLFAAHTGRGQPVELPDAEYVHLFVTGGAAMLTGGGALSAGDSVRMTNAGPGQLAAGIGDAAAELLIWAMDGPSRLN